MQKIRQSQKKEKPVKNNLEATAKKQSSKKESPSTEVTFKTSTKKRTRRKLYLDKGAETENVDQNDSNESIKILRDRHCNNVTTIKRNSLELNASKDMDSEKMANGKLQQRTSVQISPLIVTPKSTPPKLNLTPHRSKKTPKKSPISLGSPKTHSIAIPKLFKSPRKLSLATSEDSKENLKKSASDFDAKTSKKRKKNSLSNSPTFGKSVSMSPTGKTEHKKSDLIVRKFSKSPKIVLKSPKSKKSRSRKLKLLSPSRMKKSPLKTSPASPTTPTLNNNVNLSRIHIKNSPSSKEKNLSSIKRRLLNSKLTKMLTFSQIKDLLAEPVVLLERLSPESLKRKYMLMVASKTQSDTSFKVRSPSIRVDRNLMVLIPMKKAAGMSIKQNSSPKLRNSSMEKLRINNSNRISPRIKYNTSTQENNRSIPLMSSTPREEKRALTDTSLLSNASVASENMSFNTRLRHRNQSNIENISEPSLLETYFTEINDTSQSLLSNVTKRNVTYDKDDMEKKRENNRDNTYELEQPQTLSLRKMMKKRTSTDANLSSRDNTRKAKVRFADVASGDSARKSTNQLNRSRSSISHDVNVQNRNNIMNSAHKSKKVETPKLTQNSLISSFKRSSPRIHGGTPKTQLNRLQVTPKTSASVEKKSGKTKQKIAYIPHLFRFLYSNNVGLLIEKKSSMKKKVPNFGRIHEQMFAKSESLVDAKKRLEARHLAFSNLSIFFFFFSL